MPHPFRILVPSATLTLTLFLAPLAGSTPAKAAELRGEISRAIGSATERFDLAAATPGLLPVLDALAREQGILPAESAAFRYDGAREVWIVPLDRPKMPDAQLVLYYQPIPGRVLFLQLRQDPLAGTEMRLWSQGPEEIVFNQAGGRVLPAASGETFRLDSVGVEANLTPTEIIRCLAQALGLTIDLTGLADLLNTTPCGATTTFALGMLAYTCLGIPAPSSIIGCTIGIAKMIACDQIDCTSQGSCQRQIEFPSRRGSSWENSCASAHRSGRYAKYFTFTLAARTSVQIDVETFPRLTDPFVYLLRGAGTSGEVIASDNDSGIAWDAQIRRTLDPGTYTIEATTNLAGRTGTFTVGVKQRL
ncbi:MAG TPA: hypothetical protein VN851_22875 [Thermoanaerobaculia bacterium]|nr:hypothetical protein [Thermoanaerobaculia bacterium]